MFGLAIGVSRISTTLPSSIYSLLSGLNAATVGIIALAGVKLARKAITGPLTRLLLVGTGCAGICYNALWYLPVILITDGMITLSWALWCSSAVRMKIIEWRRHRMCCRVSEESPTKCHHQASIPAEQVKIGDGTPSKRFTWPGALPAPAIGHSNGTTTNPIESPVAGDQDIDGWASPQFPGLQLMSVKTSVMLVIAFFGERISRSRCDLRNANK